ncbi:PQQ-dependent sugar dehydrogenase, partial [Salmonella enterica]|uniref:PQQ-dependent sugar dehydrogenase n=1 Tax=Salmonella enterica TaxID=28901 RepID=UPI0032B476D0
MEYHVCPANSAIAYVIERPGRIKRIEGGVVNVVLDITSSVSTAGEGGLLGIAFDPNFASNRYVYLHFSVGSTPDT